jgi:hypothetical protein
MINLRKLPWLIPIVLFCLPVLCKADIPLNPLVRVKLSRFFSEGIQHLAVTIKAVTWPSKLLLERAIS